MNGISRKRTEFHSQNAIRKNTYINFESSKLMYVFFRIAKKFSAGKFSKF